MSGPTQSRHVRYIAWVMVVVSTVALLVMSVLFASWLFSPSGTQEQLSSTPMESPSVGVSVTSTVPVTPVPDSPTPSITLIAPTLTHGGSLIPGEPVTYRFQGIENSTFLFSVDVLEASTDFAYSVVIENESQTQLEKNVYEGNSTQFQFIPRSTELYRLRLAAESGTAGFTIRMDYAAETAVPTLTPSPLPTLDSTPTPTETSTGTPTLVPEQDADNDNSKLRGPTTTPIPTKPPDED